MNRAIRKVWGHAAAFLERRIGAIDVLIIAGLIGLVFAGVSVTREWTAPFRPSIEIDLSPLALPQYAMLSLFRGFAAYAVSLAFTLACGYWAARDRLAERVLVPLLDVLQSIPVLGFMPGLVLALIALFPRSNMGLELAAVLMIFTGQVWNMTFSFYHSLKTVPADLREAAAVYRFRWWQRLRWVEVPFSAMGLVWNSMMSMAGGWFFLMISESFVLGRRDFRLPGIGSYMSEAVARGNVPAMLWAIATMTAMIVLLDQLLWRPVVVWAQKFRVEEAGAPETMSSWFLDRLRRSRILRRVRRMLRRRVPKPEIRAAAIEPLQGAPLPPAGRMRVASTAACGAMLAVFAFGAWKLLDLLLQVPAGEWSSIGLAGSLTLGRVLLSTALATLWALPVGLAIGLSPRLSGLLQPAVQILAAFPAPMLFPLVIALLGAAGVPLGWGSILLMLLGTQGYVLFNVIAGAMATPSDLREAAFSYRFGPWRRFRLVHLPAVFPYLVTGWVTAAGGAWNASIVAEYVTFRGEMLSTRGLGSKISLAAQQANFPLLTACVLFMAAVVVLFNRTVWKRCYKLAETRFSLSR